MVINQTNSKVLSDKFFASAYKVAKMSDFYKCHTGCVVVYKNNIIASGFNCKKTHPLQRIYNKERFDSDDTPHYIHAETHALTTIINDNELNWKKVHLYILRIKGNPENEEFGLARPCPSCLKLIKNLGIINIHYTTNDGICHEILI
jgi:deoxycytidylate deaminase